MRSKLNTPIYASVLGDGHERGLVSGSTTKSRRFSTTALIESPERPSMLSLSGPLHRPRVHRTRATMNAGFPGSS